MAEFFGDRVYHYNSKILRRVEIIEVLIALLIVGLSIFSLLNYTSIKNGVIHGVESYGLGGLFIVTFFLEFVPQFLSPIFGVWAAIISGINVHLAIAYAIVASFYGSCFGFLVGKRYGSKYIPMLFRKATVDKINKFWIRYGNVFVFFSAITILPYFPMIFGTLKMSWKDFIKFGVIPRIFKFLVLGYLFQFGFWSLV